MVREANLMATKLSLPMWTNEEIEMELRELHLHIQELELKGDNADHAKAKRDMLQHALTVRNSSIKA